MKVYFVGSGPGDVELITVKGRKLIEKADRIIYAGSLINPEILEFAKPSCKLHDSSGLTLSQICGLYVEARANGETVVRLHSGDPSIYGAIREQIDWLEREGIGYEVVPGVSSFTAAAAAVGRELTVPEVSQTVILTRKAGRTPAPESLAELARHRATMCFFLSVHMIEEVIADLKKGYPHDTPLAVVERASWKDQKIVRGTLADIADKVKASGIRKTAVIIVGQALGELKARSRLYAEDFVHGYKKAGRGEAPEGAEGFDDILSDG